MFGRPACALPSLSPGPKSRISPLTGLALALVLTGSGGCASGSACTEGDCDSEAVVSYDGSINEVYTLTIEYGSESATARCNDAGSLESEDNPDWLTCGATGFNYTGVAADEGDIIVTLVLDDDEQTPVFSNELVSMDVTEEGIIEPNGPGCPPICFERFGSMLLPNLP